MKISIINILAEKKWKIPHHITFIGNIKSNEMKKLQHEPRVGVKPFQEVKLKKTIPLRRLWTRNLSKHNLRWTTNQTAV